MNRSERLESWKEIATYLGRGVTTVQRWEQQEGLPVHRLPHAKKGSIFALKSELDAWRQSRTQAGLQPGASTVDGERSPLWRLVPSRGLALAVIMIVAAAAAIARTRALDRTNSAPIVSSERRFIARPLANDAAEEGCPSLSPDGSQVVFHWNRRNDPGLYIKPLGGGQALRLATDAAGAIVECGYAKWSPVGDRIAFLAQGEAGTKNIWVMAPSGGAPRRLTSATGIGLAWAPDGRTLAFVDRNSPGEPFSIFSISLRDRQRQRLTTPPLGTFGDTYAAFSPDGARLALVRYGARWQSDLFAIRLDQIDGGALERLTTDFMGIEGIDWSPDGQEIVLGSHMGIWSVPASGGSGQKPTRVAAWDGGARFPTFSRSANAASPRLAYESEITDVNIWRWDVAKHQANRVASSTWWDDFPAMAPAGDRVAFASNRTGENEIWTANADGSDPQQVTFHRGPVVASPQWSFDGKRLAFSSHVGGNRDIYVALADGSQSTRATTAPSDESSPSWSHDGRSLYFRSDRAGIGQIWKVALSGGAPVRVTAGEASEGFESPDGRSLYFVRNTDIPGLWQIPVDGGSETLILPEIKDGQWAITDKGIYFLMPAQVGSRGATELRLFAFASGNVSVVDTLPARWGNMKTAFSASRDGRYVLSTQLDRVSRDLMLIDQWKR